MSKKSLIFSCVHISIILSLPPKIQNTISRVLVGRFRIFFIQMYDNLSFCILVLRKNLHRTLLIGSKRRRRQKNYPIFHVFAIQLELNVYVFQAKAASFTKSCEHVGQPSKEDLEVFDAKRMSQVYKNLRNSVASRIVLIDRNQSVMKGTRFVDFSTFK